MMADRTKDNPFYSNHVFNMEDLNRKVLQITWVERMLLKLLPTYVQLAGDSDNVFYYKRWNGRYYLMDVRPVSQLHLTITKPFRGA